MRSHIRYQWIPTPGTGQFRTGVSLHSHTLHSRESFDFLRRAGLRTPLISDLILNIEKRYYKRRGKPLDLNKAWWTPPLGPREIWKQERAQLESLGFDPLVALTDHDDIQAPLGLRVMRESRDVPIAVEWTVPFGPTFFHLGVFNLPARSAQDLFAAMQKFRIAPDLHKLPDIFSAITKNEGSLVVFNHPMWDENCIGEARYEEAVRMFIRMYSPFIHALELNGLRPPQENESVKALASSVGKPLISGGDRHGPETNAVVNLTDASDFGEFAEEIRSGWSNILFLKSYKKPHTLRMIRSTLDMFRTYSAHPNGWRVWTDRAFQKSEDGAVQCFTELLGPARAGLACCLGFAFGKPMLSDTGNS
ncbi:MAG: hypothetical protein JO307_06700 [Bryobacterales bacterium]|nr:hypothetical protein [Bryobacterales bacterium]MBV9398124.1 hypothetical protein [Bryobacterales bacterium]